MAGKAPQSDRTALPVIRLTPTRGNGTSHANWVTAKAKIKLGGESLQLEISTPPGLTALRDLLPVFEGFANAVVDVAVRAVENQGLTISCQKGCGACCRQLVPISPTEAHHLAQVVAALPEPRQSELRTRFADAIEKLNDAGLLDRLRQPGGESGRELRPLGLAYFALGIPCPFLEDESCSIHPDRPLACREYLVTSPAENCARPNPEDVHCVPLPAKVSGAFRELEKQESASAPAWMPLILALEWAKSHVELPPSRPGSKIVEGFFRAMSKAPTEPTNS